MDIGRGEIKQNDLLSKINRFSMLLGFTAWGFVISASTLLASYTWGDMDAYARANIGFDFFRKHITYDFTAGTPWLPLHFTFLSLSNFIFKDPILAPRAISLLFNIASIPLMYIFVENLLANHKNRHLVAIVSALVYLFHPFRIFFATQVLSETISMFFLLLVLALASLKKIPVYWLALGVGMGALIRYEFWFLIPILLIAINLDDTLSLRNRILGSILLFVAPIYWLALNALDTGSTLDFFKIKYGIAQGATPMVSYYNFWYASKAWFDSTLNLTGVFGMLIAIYGAVKLFSEKTIHIKNHLLASLPIYFLFVLVIQVYIGTMEGLLTRYLYPVVIGLIPLFSYGLISILEELWLRRKNLNLMLFALFVAIFWIAEIKGILQSKEGIIQTVNANDLEQIAQISEYVNTHKAELADKKIYVVDNPEWLMPMFVYLTQRHDIDQGSVTPTSYLKEKPRKNSLYVIKNNLEPALSCGKTPVLTNQLFTLCKF